MPIGVIDLDLVSINTMNTDRGYSVDYLEYCLRKYAKKIFVMFAHNCSGHWILLSLFQSGSTSTPVEVGRQI